MLLEYKRFDKIYLLKVNKTASGREIVKLEPIRTKLLKELPRIRSSQSKLRLIPYNKNGTYIGTI
ncbi:hypothetical protein JK636_04495 [Clostridium sp. YIM B02515]|uniref:Uncharacterized protein n=1 Tax=Clostridium rhizosphaerae TaxID=2803861 RepID=A0ABS1T6P8_9CLOT|nr:hypothetical protein [Clostridium rhizosphaerae]